MTEHIIVSDTIYLDTIRESDLAVLSRKINDPEVEKNTLGVPYPYTIEDAKDFFTKVKKREESIGRQTFWIIKMEDELIGAISLAYNYGEEAHLSEIGYWLTKELRGKGIMKEVIDKFCVHHFERGQIKRIEAHVFSFNTSSMRVLEKAGFMREGLVRKKFVKSGEFLDAELYSRIV